MNARGKLLRNFLTGCRPRSTHSCLSMQTFQLDAHHYIQMQWMPGTTTISHSTTPSPFCTLLDVLRVFTACLGILNFVFMQKCCMHFVHILLISKRQTMFYNCQYFESVPSAGLVTLGAVTHGVTSAPPPFFNTEIRLHPHHTLFSAMDCS